MSFKDYYEILEVPVNASADEIRKAYRKLAMRYHPDRNHANPYARQHFQEISEAYEILSNPVQRSEYQEKRKSFYPGEKAHPVPLTPRDLVSQAVELEKTWYGMDIFRMDHIMLQARLLRLLGDRHLQIMTTTGSQAEVQCFFESVLRTAALLPFPLLPEVVTRLAHLGNRFPPAAKQLAGFMRERKVQYSWEKYKECFVLFLALAISLFIYLIA
ncbi:MAG: DnaJ domain-containing protein [Flavihumibacter sp.]